MTTKRNVVFKDFDEYWHYVRCMSDNQKEILFNSLALSERKRLLVSCDEGHWDDLLNRDILNNLVSEIEKKYGYNLIEIRLKVLLGKSVYLPSNFWDMVVKKLAGYKDKHLNFILGGIEVKKCKANEKVVFLSPQKV
jgi:hypothetical protein